MAAETFKIGQIHTGVKDHLTKICWSANGLRLAVGTEKGNVVIHDQRTSKKLSLLGKHTRRITCGVWNKDGVLVLGGEDKLITVNTPDGDLITQCSLQDYPTQLQFYSSNSPSSSTIYENMVSCIVGSKHLIIFDVEDVQNPTELTFPVHYGSLVAYRWLCDGCVAVGFSMGQFVVTSTRKNVLGKELYQVCDHKDGLYDIAVSIPLGRCATSGDHCVKIHDLKNVKELTAIIEFDQGDASGEDRKVDIRIAHRPKACQLQWSDDGQLMAVSNSRRQLHVFLSQLPKLAAVAVSQGAELTVRLSSLLEITVEMSPVLLEGEKSQVPAAFRKPVTLTAEVEPTFLALGSRYLAHGAGNRVWFHELSDRGIEQVSQRDYPDLIQRISVGTHYVALCGADGKLMLHWIDPKTLSTRDGSPGQPVSDAHAQTSRESRVFPDGKHDGEKVTCFQMTQNFLVYATDTGRLVNFLLDDWEQINEYQHTCGIRSIFPNWTGTRAAFIDQRSAAYIYKPVGDQLIQLPDLSPSVTQILWDTGTPENTVLIACDEKLLLVYRHAAQGALLGHGLAAVSGRNQGGFLSRQLAEPGSEKGGKSGDSATAAAQDVSICQQVMLGTCQLVGTSRLPHGHVPLSVVAGQVCLLNPKGWLKQQLLTTHAFLAYGQASGECSGEAEGRRSEEVDRKRTTAKASVATPLVELPPTELISLFEQAMRMGYYDDACLFAEQLKEHQYWSQLGMTCLRVMRFDIAVRAFRQSNQPSLVLAVQRIEHIEDRLLTSGYIAMILKEFDKAQELFLASSKPVAALEMRRDLLHWDAALQLAQSLAPSETPAICREYAMELECIGDYVGALMFYERGLVNPVGLTEATRETWRTVCKTNATNVTERSTEQGDYSVGGGCVGSGVHLPGSFTTRDGDRKEHFDMCTAGIARNTIRLGDKQRGLDLAKESRNAALQKECADILEQMKCWQEAATLYELADCLEQAVTVHLRFKNYRMAGRLLKGMPHAHRLHLLYARSREADGSFQEAVGAYEMAQEWEAVVRLYLEKLANPEEAVRVVRATKSLEGSKMIAQYFVRINDHASAIQFLVMSRCLEDAFQLARKHRKMELYAEALGSNACSSEYQSIACYFENERKWCLAGKYYLMAKQYEKAIRQLLRTPYSEDSVALDLALEAVGLAADARLTNMLIVYLMGETDGVPKDARHLFRLYMVLRQYKEAARTAVIIAREEQISGNYRSAHDLLFGMVQELRQRDLRVPSEMADNLALLHSYILAKVHVKNNAHLRAARMLIRVAESISKFPAHIVPILTSTVIECQKAGLKAASFGYAAMLLRPEYRDKLDPKHRKKFETLIRRPDRKPETGEAGNQPPEQEAGTPCPSCGALLCGTSLYCTECRNTLPYCLITGNHVVKNDFTTCPNCRFPAIYGELMRFVETYESRACPMCTAELSRDSIHRVADPTKLIDTWLATTDQAEANGTENGADENNSADMNPL